MSRSVYFFLAPHEYYNDAILYLAEGLLELGFQCFGNRSFWKTSPKDNTWLIQANPSVRPHDCDFSVITTYWLHYMDPETLEISTHPLPSELIRPRSFPAILIDPLDGYSTLSWKSEFKNFDLILRPKFNRRTYNPENMIPWVLGYTRRVVRATRTDKPFNERRKAVVENYYFTHSYRHQARVLADQIILRKLENQIFIDRTISAGTAPEDPWDLLDWLQTKRKHNPDYYRQLAGSQCAACFCGRLIPPKPFNPSKLLSGGRRSQILMAYYQTQQCISGGVSRIIQWDSWRFWETLIAGAVALHFDLADCGVDLPVMPQNWEHYIGFNLARIKRDLDRFNDLSSADLEMIGNAGNRWATKYYSPRASAERLVVMLEEKRSRARAY